MDVEEIAGDSLLPGFFTFSVSQLNRYIKDLFSMDDLLSGVWLRGEASNVTKHASGHIYFTLKDENGQINCVMWRPETFRLRCSIKNGGQYLAYGRVTLWDKRGSLQFVAEHMETEGRGSLHVAYERLRAKLTEEGLFDLDRKRPLPFLPQRIGLITSPTGAAVHDMVRTLRERHPRLDILILPALVQGIDAPESIAGAIEKACRLPDLDLLIVGRGGGSLEDLWAFNDEQVVRAISECSIPVVTAIGHETDFTLSDFAADLRAPTPTAAAQAVVPHAAELEDRIRQRMEDAAAALHRRIYHERRRVLQSLDRAAFLHPLEITRRRRKEVERQAARLQSAMNDRMRHERQRTAGLVGQLEALSPLGVISRGYALALKGDEVVRSVDDVAPGEDVTVRISDGLLQCEVKDTQRSR